MCFGTHEHHLIRLLSLCHSETGFTVTALLAASSSLEVPCKVGITLFQ